MTAADWSRIKALFDAALDVEGAARDAFVVRGCGGDAALLSEVRALLEADTGTEPSSPLVDGAPGTALATGDLVGTTFAGFHVVRRLGRGGMGAVYEARQERPQRTVALKTLDVPFPSDRARRRFEDEAEILARLRHPAIAQVLAAGSARVGTVDVPWFAMELVEEPRAIDQFVRERQLGLRAVLALFSSVCDAVHCAHQHGVIHRDLKPANVLVDRRGQAKLIDFGIARLAERDAEARFTRTGEILGTLAYMSPERLERAGIDDGTPVDVYALGVMLYELLAGSPPVPIDALPPARVMELLLAADPPPPSHHAPAIPVELDWITRKAMAREPERRYASADALAQDLRRFAQDEPVSASPPSATYRLRKLAWRHRVLLGVAATAFLAVSIGFVVAMVGWRRVAAAEQLAQRKAATLSDVNRFQENVLFSAQMESVDGDLRLVDAVDHAAARIQRRKFHDPVAEVATRRAVGNAYLGLGRLQDAEEHLLRAKAVLSEHDIDRKEGWHELVADSLAQLYQKQGRHELAEREARQSLADCLAFFGTDSVATAVARHNLASMLVGNDAGRAEALELAADALSTFDRAADSPADRAVHARTLVAGALADLRRFDEAERMFAEALACAERELDEDHPARLATLGAWASFLFFQRRFAESAPLHARLAAAWERTRGAHHPRTLSAQSSLAAAQGELGRYGDAEATLRRVVAGFEALGVRGGLDLVKAQQSLVGSIRRQGRAAEAEPLARHNRDLADRTLPNDHWLAGVVMKEHGACLRELGRSAEAEEALLAGHARLVRLLGEKDYRTQRVIAELIELYDAWPRAEDAAAWRARFVGPER